MKKYLIVFFLALSACTGVPEQAKAQATACCDDAACKATAQQLLRDLEKEINLLGACPADFAERKKKLEDLRIDKPASYDRLRKALDKAHNWYINDLSRRKCFTKLYAALPDDALNWIELLSTLFFVSNFRSPEFAKGFGAHIHLDLGCIDVFKKSERFVFSGGALLSYTFTPKGRVTGGRTRLMLGPSILYSRQIVYLLANPKVEFRLKDIGNEMTSLGCWKFIAQGNIGADMQMAGVGISMDLSRVAIDLSFDNDFKHKDYFLKIGLMYSMFFKKDKK